MFVALLIVCCALALALAATGVAKLTGHPATRDSLESVGFPARWVPALAAAELAGAAGLLIGLWWWPIGAAAACGIVAYFLGAIGAHVRARMGSVTPAATLLVMAIAALVLRLMTV